MFFCCIFAIKDRLYLLKVFTNPNTVWEVSKYRVFSGPYFPVFGLNTEIYRVHLRIQSEYRKLRSRKNSVFGYFSHSASCNDLLLASFKPNFMITSVSKTGIPENRKTLLLACSFIFEEKLWSTKYCRSYCKLKTEYFSFLLSFQSDSLFCFIEENDNCEKYMHLASFITFF